jgi:hypothetical protein
VYKNRWAIEAFFVAQAKLAGADVRGDLGEGFAVADLHGTDCPATDQALQLRASFGWHLVARLRQQRFVYRDQWTWIDNPFQPPPGGNAGAGTVIFKSGLAQIWTAELAAGGPLQNQETVSTWRAPCLDGV